MACLEGRNFTIKLYPQKEMKSLHASPEGSIGGFRAAPACTCLCASYASCGRESFQLPITSSYLLGPACVSIPIRRSASPKRSEARAFREALAAGEHSRSRMIPVSRTRSSTPRRRWLVVACANRSFAACSSFSMVRRASRPGSRRRRRDWPSLWTAS